MRPADKTNTRGDGDECPRDSPSVQLRRASVREETGPQEDEPARSPASQGPAQRTDLLTTGPSAARTLNVHARDQRCASTRKPLAL